MFIRRSRSSQDYQRHLKSANFVQMYRVDKYF